MARSPLETEDTVVVDPTDAVPIGAAEPIAATAPTALPPLDVDAEAGRLLRDAAPAAPRSVAVVHDYLNQRGGAERVVLELARLFPSAEIHTTLYRPGSTYPEFAERTVRTSFLDRLPVDDRFRVLAPALPAAIRSLGVLDEEVVVSSSSGWAHGVATAPDTLHVVYCHTPARWLYCPDRYLPKGGARAAMTPLLRRLRRWDQQAARRPDLYVANSRHVRDRLRRVYGIDADVVHPPVDTTRFSASPRGSRLLVVSRLLRYKRVDLVVDAATRAGLALDVVGTGPLLDDLRRRAGSTVTFHGEVGDADVVALMERCSAVVVPGVEDFGIVPLEANAAGKPVIAFGRGGALETVRDGRTGVLFAEQSPTAVLDAVRRCEALAADPEDLAAHARSFGADRFRREMAERIGAALDAQRAALAQHP